MKNYRGKPQTMRDRDFQTRVRRENAAFLRHLKIWGAIIIVGLLAFAFNARADTHEMYASEEADISFSLQGVRAQYTHLTSKRWGVYAALGYVDNRPYAALGGTFLWSDRFQSYAGAAYMARNERIGSNWHYDLIPIRFNVSHTVAVQWNHKSNNRSFTSLFPGGGDPNDAYDIIEVVWRTRFLR